MNDNATHPGEDSNVPPVNIESEAWLMAQIETAGLYPASYAVGDEVVLTRSVRDDDIKIRRATRGKVTKVTLENDFGPEWVYDVDCEGLRWEVIESSTDYSDAPGPDDPGRWLWLAAHLYDEGKVIGYSSVYRVVGEDIRPAGEVIRRTRRTKAA